MGTTYLKRQKEMKRRLVEFRRSDWKPCLYAPLCNRPARYW